MVLRLLGFLAFWFDWVYCSWFYLKKKITTKDSQKISSDWLKVQKIRDRQIPLRDGVYDPKKNTPD